MWQKDLSKIYADKRRQSLPSTASPRDLVLMRNQGENKLSAKVHLEPVMVTGHHGSAVNVCTPEGSQLERNVSDFHSP
jgi:hypothetical protein